MVKSVTSLTRNGLRDWLFQRVSAILIAAYIIFLVGFILCHPNLNYASWLGLFHNNFMRLATLLVLIAILLHAYIGMWTIFTDYLKNTMVRLIAEIIVFICLLAFVIWGVMILWGAS
jgi:succinate dehydrogenase / fumarate reductase membrane anchor subunit